MSKPLGFIICLIFLESCGIDNHDHMATRRAFDKETFFPDEAAARTPPRGTIAWDSGTNELGKNGYPSKLKLSKPFLEHGKTLFEQHCVVCHGYDGEGKGIVTTRGLLPPPSYLSQEVLTLSPEDLVRVMTEGKGRMPSYARRLLEEERWAVAAYVKALQLSRNIHIEKLDYADKKHFE